MRMSKAVLIVVAALLATPALAAADEEERIDRYDFTDDIVQGDLIRPDGVRLVARNRRDRESLIHVRDNFVAELYKSVQNI